MAIPPLVSRDRLESEEPGPLLHGEKRGVCGYVCDVCARRFDGQPAGSGLLLWTRGEDVRYEEPPLCEDCAERVTLGALVAWHTEEEEEG